MLIQHFGSDLLAEINLGLAIIAKVSLKFDDIEIEVVQRRAHGIEPVLRFYDQLMVAVRMGPLFLLFRECPIPALASPFGPSTADPAVENLSIGKFDHVTEF